jgi:DEAD/DEAH box helicase domain-containing protein
VTQSERTGTGGAETTRPTSAQTAQTSQTNVEQWLDALRMDPDPPASIVAHHRTEPHPASTAPFPDWVHEGLRQALEARGILSLYSHQRRAADLLHDGRSVVVATPTASGKSLCYQLPVLDRLFREPGDARALYLYPTKALARDQLADMERLIGDAKAKDVVLSVYDGDTPPSVRRALREAGHLVLTNPHMLHVGILPNHVKWQGLFTGLRYVVVDEVHTLSGVYGSHVANVLRRLKRICAHYGSQPTFCAASATIRNPGEHATRLLETPVEVVDEDGSARGAKHYVFLNPPLQSAVSGLRASAVETARHVVARLLPTDLQTIVFTRTRNTLEVLLKYVRDEASRRNVDQERIAGYRGGYLPDLRRKIEQGLRSGRISTVVATSALELGVDIGSLDVCLLVGYPGTVSSTFQRAGRVGRRGRSSLVLFLARGFAMDQYLVHNPGYLFDEPREVVAIDPDNPIVLTNHVKCAAFELPFDLGASDTFGQAPHLRDVLDFLTDDLRLLVREGSRYHFGGPTFPADGVSLSAVEADNVVIMDRESRTVLGEIDRAAAITEVHEGAIYGHQGDQYQVDEFVYADRRAYVKKVTVDWYTQAETETEIRVLHVDETTTFATYAAHRGEVHVSTLAKAYKKVRFYTGENVGAGDIHLPPEEFETEACVLALDPSLAAEVGLDKGADAGGLRGIAELIQGLVPLFLRVDPGDVRVLAELRHPHFERPTITIYDAMPDGVGLSERIWRQHRDVLAAAAGLVERCPCRTGCPSCIGPSVDQGVRGKGLARAVLSGLLR